MEKSSPNGSLKYVDILKIIPLNLWQNFFIVEYKCFPQNEGRFTKFMSYLGSSFMATFCFPPALRIKGKPEFMKLLQINKQVKKLLHI